MMTFYLILSLWIIAGIGAGCWSVGQIHGYENTHYQQLNNSPRWEYLVMGIIAPPIVLIVATDYSISNWQWPVDGVTYNV